MAEDFYLNDYGGGFYSGGGGGDYYGSGSSGDDFYYGYGGDQPTSDVVHGSPYEDIFFGFLDDYLNMGYDPLTAITLAEQDRAAEQISLPTLEQGALPNVSLPTIPYVTPYLPDFGLIPDTFQEGDYFALPPPPAPPGVRLPPACAGGTYHPYPIGHAQQDICVPFPPAPPQQQQRPPQQSGQGQQQAPKPPQQQQQSCPTTQCKHPQTGQCMPIPQGYTRHPQTQVCIPRCATGTVFDQARGLCVPQGQAVSPLPSEFDDMFADLKNLPWWVWAGLAGVVVLTQRGGR